MKELKKDLNPKQAEFKRLRDSVDWNNAEVARQIGLSRPGVGKIINGQTTPEDENLDKLRDAVAVYEMRQREVSERLTNPSIPLIEEQLDQMEVSLVRVRRYLAALKVHGPVSPKNIPGFSSIVSDAGRQTGPNAVEKAKREAASHSPLPRTVGPISYKADSKREAAARSKKQSGPPIQAPGEPEH